MKTKQASRPKSVSASANRKIEQRRIRYAGHKEQEKAAMRAYYQKHKARLDAKSLARYHQNKVAILDRRMVLAYGIDKAGVAALLESQKGCCAICRTSDPGKPGWHLDHDHRTKLPRGVLCSCCNTGIGLLRDSPEILHNAALYLEAHNNLRSVSNA